jgi:hypothetical protein
MPQKIIPHIPPITELVLKAAYGRTYLTKSTVEKDFREGKDFWTPFGYASIRDFQPGQEAMLRYGPRGDLITVVMV